MENKLEYSFDDEPVSEFCYNIDKEVLKIHFNAYYDLVKNERVNKPCIWILENWEYAKSRIGDEEKLYDLNKHIGVFSLILYMKYNDDKELEMQVNTVDNRYITLFIKGPKLSLK